ncbi:hypothetical protein COR53_00290 [Staphylococcus pettenkoferi]|nr:hypothetical protein [Clostridioides difficile]RQN01186.1 hypothetical protein COR53_00290 [Staphylococcus pettenkoferi]
MYIIENKKFSFISLFLTVVLFFISYFTDSNIFRGLMFLFLGLSFFYYSKITGYILSFIALIVIIGSFIF